MVKAAATGGSGRAADAGGAHLIVCHLFRSLVSCVDFTFTCLLLPWRVCVYACNKKPSNQLQQQQQHQNTSFVSFEDFVKCRIVITILATWIQKQQAHHVTARQWNFCAQRRNLNAYDSYQTWHTME